MAPMIALPEPLPAVHLEDLDLTAFDAKRADDGLVATVSAVNGTAKLRRLVAFSDRESCQSFASELAAVPGVSVKIPQAVAKLAELSLAVEQALRKAPLEVEWTEPVSFDERELSAFPTDALPEWLRRYVDALAEETQTAPDLAAMLGLAILATCAQKIVIVQVRQGWREPVNLFIAVAQEPGSRKSAVFEAAAAPIMAFEARELQRVGPEVAKAASDRKILEAALARAEADAAKAAGDARLGKTAAAHDLAEELAKTTVPAYPQLIADDCSPEKLIGLIRDQGGAISVLSPEGDTFDIMAGRYSGTPNLGVYLKGHAGDTLRVDRVNRASEYVAEPKLTLGLAVQPDVLRGLMEKPGFRGRGLLGRFLYSLPRSRMGHRSTDPTPMPAAVKMTYEKHVITLLEMDAAHDEHGRPSPRLLTLTPDAHQRIKAFSAWLEPQLVDDGDLGTLRDWAGKLAGAVVRIAGLLHVATFASEGARSWRQEIDGRAMEQAIRIGTYLIPHAKAAYAEMGADPEIDGARRLLTWIGKADAATFTKRDAYQGTKGTFRKVEALDAPLRLLVAHGYIKQAEDEARSGPGRKRSPTYYVNPLWREGNSGNTGNCGNGDETPQIRRVRVEL